MIVNGTTPNTTWYGLQQSADNMAQTIATAGGATPAAQAQDAQAAADSRAFMAAGSNSRLFGTPFWHFRKRVVMQQAKELSATRSGDAVGRAKALAWQERHDAKLEAGKIGSYLEALIGTPNATLEDIAAHYAERFAKADAFEERYHDGKGSTNLLRKAAKIRSQSLTELGFLGVDPQAMGEGGLRAVRSGLNASAIARCFGENANAIGIALSIATNMTAHIGALSSTLNDMNVASTRDHTPHSEEPV